MCVCVDVKVTLADVFFLGAEEAVKAKMDPDVRAYFEQQQALQAGQVPPEQVPVPAAHA